MKKAFLVIVLNLLALSFSAHPWKSQHYVIVDTDCGLDDFRTLCMLMASPDVRVLAITTSDGVLDARAGLAKVRSLLYDLHHEGILTGFNSDSNVRAEMCLPAMRMDWGKPVSGISDIPHAADVVNYVLDNTNERITFISLGSLNTVRLCAERCPGFHAKVVRILWSSPVDYKNNSYNFNLDQNSALRVISGKTPVNLVCSGSFKHYDETLIKTITGMRTVFAEKVKMSITAPENPYAGAVCDESTAVFLHYPDLFHVDTVGNLILFQLKPSVTGSDIQSAFYNILSGETINQNQVISSFPLDSSYYIDDVQPIRSETLVKFGREEWISNVIANELHRHLGVYAVIGVKMGVRAKEYFGAGIDEMNVISYAGHAPPFSCLNDGLQVSTGATLGHGLIRISADSLKLPQADFIYMNQKIRLSLKPEIRSKVESEIRELSRIYGLDSNIYWELVRKAAIRYWSTLSRHDVFTIQVL